MKKHPLFPVGLLFLALITATIMPGARSIVRAQEKPAIRMICELGDSKSLGLAAALSRDGKRVVSGSLLQGLTLWDVDKGKQIRRFLGKGISSISFSADGKRLVTAGDDKTVRVWNALTGKESLRFVGSFGRVRCAILSPSGRSILSAGSGAGDAAVHLWDSASGREVRRYLGHDFGVESLAFAPDGKKFVSGGLDKTIRLWSVAKTKEVLALVGHDGPVLCLAFSPDGKKILSGGADKTVRLWDVETGMEIQKMAEPMGAVNSVAFLPGGRYAVSGSGGEFTVRPTGRGVEISTKKGKKQAARLWDLQTGKEVYLFPAHNMAVIFVGVSADGRRLLTASANGAMRVWELPAAKDLPALKSPPP